MTDACYLGWGTLQPRFLSQPPSASQVVFAPYFLHGNDFISLSCIGCGFGESDFYFVHLSLCGLPKIKRTGQTWRCRHVTLTLRRLRLEDLEFEASLAFTVRLCLRSQKIKPNRKDSRTASEARSLNGSKL